MWLRKADSHIIKIKIKLKLITYFVYMTLKINNLNNELSTKLNESNSLCLL